MEAGSLGYDAGKGRLHILHDHQTAGKDSGPFALELERCLDYDIGFSYHQTGARLIKDGKLYNIPRKLQHEQAWKAGLDYK